MTADTNIVYEFAKNVTEQVRASITTFKGKRYADLRVYFKADDGKYYPTKKGVNVPLDLLDELDKAVEQLQQAAKHSERGAQ